MKRLIFILFCLSFLFCEGPIVAEDQEQFEQQEEVEGRDFTSEFSNMLLTLGLIVLVMLLATWLFKKAMHSRIQQINVTSLIKVLETRTLSTKLSVHLIEVCNRGIVFAESATGVAKLTEVSLEGEEEKPSFGEILEPKKRS